MLADLEIESRIITSTLPVKEQRFLEFVASGLEPRDAAIKLGYKPRGAAFFVSRVMAKPESIELLNLLRERIRRLSGCSVGWLLSRFRDVATRASNDKDYRASIMALKEIGAIAGLYPDQGLVVDVRHSAVQISDADILKLAQLNVIDVVGEVVDDERG